MSYPPAIYHWESGEVSARLVRGDGEPALVHPDGNKVFHLALGSGTGGTYGLYRWEFGGLHGFRNEDGPATMLLHSAPGAPREAYFEQLAEGTADMSPEEYDAFMREHDNIWV